MTSSFVSVPISSLWQFSWVFFVDWFLTFALSIGIIFHFPRLTGYLISLMLRITVCRQQGVRLDVQSVKFSFLAGRITFKNLTYIDGDQTVCMSQGSLTWRYWLSACKRRNLDIMDHEDIDLGVNNKLPCRFILEIEGFEYFIYNRTVSYDNILKTLSEEINASKNKNKESYDIFTSTASDNTIEEIEDPVVKPSLLSVYFPLQLRIAKGGIVMGNKTTHAVIIASFNSIDGTIDLAKPSNPLDGLSQVHDIDIERLEVSLKPNILHEMEVDELSSKFKRSKKFEMIRKFFKKIGFVKESLNTQTETWKGLSRYLGDDTETISDIIQDEEFDYAKYTTILLAEKCNLRYIYDFPGICPKNPIPTSPFEGLDVGNGGSAPRYDYNVQLIGATIHYGPWADRQRHTLLQMLSPSICRDAIPTQRLVPGQRRIFTNVTFNIEVVDNLIVRVPTREVSKDEEYKNHDPNSTRPFGWIELKVNKESTISLSNSLLASKTGYENKLEMTLFDLEARSSVNHDIFLKCKEHTFSSDIGYPLSWNGHTTWSLFNRSSDVETFLLREHITLISDLFSDFGSGDPTPYELFRPFTYVFDWKIDGYKLFFNINDANIVNNPLDFNENVYLSFQGDSMKIYVNIPLDSIIRKSTTVDYKIETPDFSFVLDTPPWHTLNNFLKSKEVGRCKRFIINGSYTYYPELGIDAIDTVIINCEGEHLALECYGFVVKYIMGIKENYFGDFTRFKTLEEYTKSLNDLENKSVDENQRNLNGPAILKRTENETDVHFSFCLKDSCAILPSNIYDCHSNVSLPFEYLDIDIRFTNYYMDMQVDSSPIKGYYFNYCDTTELLNPDTFKYKEQYDLLIDILSIHGHRMFGLPPDEPTCFCKWDILPGNITFNGSVEAIHGLINSVLKLGFGYSNLENKLDLEEPKLWDTTNVSIFVPKIDFTFTEPDLDQEIKLFASSIAFRFNDITNFRFTNKISVDLEELNLSIKDLRDGKTLFDFKTSIRVTNFCLKKDYENIKRSQDEHMIAHDGPFHRLPFLIDEELKLTYNQLRGSIIPGFSIPSGNPPLNAETADILFAEMGLNATYSDAFNIFDDESNESSFSVNNNDAVRVTSYGNKYKDTVSGIHTEATTDYDPEEYTPLYKGDPDYETDGAVLNFGNIDLNLCLESLIVLLNFADKSIEQSFEAVLDGLQLAVLKKLKRKFNTDLSCLNLRFVSPIINLNLTRESWDPSVADLDGMDNINCFIDSPSLVLSNKQNLTGPANSSLAFHMASLGVSFNEANKPESALNISLEDLEVWLSEKHQKMAFSFNLKSIGIGLHAPSLNWFLSFIKTIIDYAEEYENLLDKVISKSKLAAISLVHHVAVASSKYNVEHDPAVITRPAYVIRLSKKHIRANDSWNVIVRLRHIFNELPEEWISDTKFNCSDISPETAMNEVLNVFRQWRSWEFADISDSFIFKYVFSKTSDDVEILDTSTDIIISQLLFSLYSKDESSNYVKVNKFEASTSKEIEEKEEESNEMTEEVLKTLAVRVGEIQSNITPLELNLELLKIPEYSSKPKDTLKPVKKVVPNDILDHIIIMVDLIDLKINLKNTAYQFELNNLSSSIVTKKKLDLKTETSLYNLLERTEIKAFIQDQSILTYGITNIAMVGIYSNDSSENINLLETSSETAYFSVTGSHGSVNDFVLGLKEDMVAVKRLIPGPADSKNIEKSNELELKSVTNYNYSNNLKLKVFNRNFNWDLSLFDPFSINGTSEHFEVSLILDQGKVSVILELSHSGLDIETIEGKYPVLRNISNRFSFGATYFISENSIALTLDTGEITFNVSDVLFKFDPIYSYLQNLQKNVNSLMESVKQLVKVFDDCSVSEPQKKSPDLLISELLINNKLFCFGIKQDDTLFSINLSEVSLQYFNLVFSSTPNKSWPYGEMSVKSTQLNVNHGGINPDHSKVVDFSFGMKIINVVQSEDQTLEVESKYSRLMFSPVTSAKLFGLIKGFKYVSYKFKGLFLSNEVDIEIPKKSTPEIWKELGFSSIHILSYNFCLGFIFDSPSHSSPGLITGCEKVFAVTEGSLGKLTIIGGYLSLAHGNKTDSFFSGGNEVSRPNRAFLPNVQVTYSILHNGKNQDILINVSGEQLDVKFITSSIIFVEQIISSASTVQKLIKDQVEWKSEPQSPTTQENYSLPDNVTSIRCTMSFAGAIVKMTRWEDFNNENDPYAPSFELQAPAIKMITEYAKNKGSKTHFVNFEVFTYSSSNTLHSTCVPILYDVWKTLNYLGKQNQRRSSLEPPTSEINKAASPTNLKDLLKIFNRFQVQFVLHIDKQELTLSCEPSAKVQAVVGIESIDIHMGSSQTSDDYPFSGTISVGAVGASLQHSFSREISASFMISEIIMTAMLTGHDSFKLYTAAEFNKVKSYLYLKQLQDVDLFFDLWRFTDYGVSSDSVKSFAISSNKGIEEGIVLKKFQRVSNAAMIPWDIYFIVKDLDFEVDLGQSLGVLSLNFDQIDITSRKQSDRKQELLILFETVALKSKGRLGGHLIVKDIQTRTLINWSILGDSYDIPIVLLSFGFQSIEIKSSFDYNVFMIGKIQRFFISIFNQVDEHKILQDRLVATTECESIELYITSFAASNIMDIFNTLARIRQDNKTSYKQNLQPGTSKIEEGDSYKNDDDIIDILAKLRTELNFKLGKILLHVYPGSLLDSQVLIINIGELNSTFEQHSIKSKNKIETDLKLNLNDINVSLSSFKTQLAEDLINFLTIDDFIKNSTNATGGNIFTFPALNILMTTFIEPKSTMVKYIYKSWFGGKVDIRWNLGSINFIRQMWMIHVKSISTRISKEENFEDKVPLFMDEKFDEKIRDVTLGDKYQYVPLEEPMIEVPQLKELGDATPPLEWFGLNRQNFPGLTHQFVIFSLQKLVQEVETQYAWVLGKA